MNNLVKYGYIYGKLWNNYYDNNDMFKQLRVFSRNYFDTTTQEEILRTGMIGSYWSTDVYVTRNFGRNKK